MEYLQKHKPKNTNSRLQILNHIDTHLANHNPSVFLAASKLFQKVISEDPETLKLMGDFLERIQPQFRKFLKDPVNSEFHHALLKFVTEIKDDASIMQLSRHYKDFKFIPNERIELSQVKCEILQRLASAKGCEMELKDDITKYMLTQLVHGSHSHPFEVNIRRILCYYK